MANSYAFISGNTLATYNGLTYANQSSITVPTNLTITGNVICNTIVIPGGGGSPANSAFKARISTTNTVSFPWYYPAFPGFPPNPTPQYSNTFLLRADVIVTEGRQAYNNSSNFATIGGIFLGEYEFGPNTAGLYNVYSALNLYCDSSANVILEIKKNGSAHTYSYIYSSTGGEEYISVNDILYLNGTGDTCRVFVTISSQGQVNVIASTTGSYIGAELILPVDIGI